MMQEMLAILPEILLAGTLACVIAAEVTYRGERIRLTSGIALLGLAAAFVQTLILYRSGPQQAFGNSWVNDGLSVFFKLLFIALAAITVLASSQAKEIGQQRWAEYCALIIASCLAMCTVASAADMLLVFLALQLLNVQACFLAGYGKRSPYSIEAAFKYLIFMAASGALLLYGFAILFASTHTLNIFEVHRTLSVAPLVRETMLVVFSLVFLALSFQFAAFPMHLWAPDVLEGSPTPSSGFLSVGTRAAGFVVALRFLMVMFARPIHGPPVSPGGAQWQVLGLLDWTKMVAVVAALTLLVGSLLAFRQQRAKRLVGCLVVVQTGYFLLGLLVLDEIGVTALLYNWVIELFSLMGVFFVLSFLVDELGSDRMEAMKGMLGRAVPECVCLILFLLCLVGVPPMPGFFGKFTLVGIVVQHGWPLLGVMAMVATALSMVAVGRLAYHLVAGIADPLPARVPDPAPSVARRLLLGALLLPLALAGMFAQEVLAWAGRSVDQILW